MFSPRDPNCNTCGGTGAIADGHHGHYGFDCLSCGGTGKVKHEYAPGMLALEESSLIDANVLAVVTRFAERSRTGYQKYGVTTERGDLTLLEWLVHLQDELMDATIYVERLKKDIHGAINQAAHKYIHELADMGFIEAPKGNGNGKN